MIEETDFPRFVAVLLDGDFQSVTNRFLAHGWMSAKGNQHVEFFGRHTNLSKDGFEQKSDGRGAGMVGNDEQNLFALVVRDRKRLRYKLHDLRIGNLVANRTNLKSGVLHGERLVPGGCKIHPVRVQSRVNQVFRSSNAKAEELAVATTRQSLGAQRRREC